MNIGHLTFSTLGGAGRVAERLSKYQNDLGNNSKLIALSQSNIGVDPFARPSLTIRALTDKYLVQNKPQNTLFSDYRKNYRGIDLNELADLDVLNLHWVEGVVRESSLLHLKRRSSKLKIIWTLHDMAPFTGGCHHAHACNGFQYSCTNCPQVRSPFKKQITNNFQSLSSHKEFYESTIFVAPSKWMSEKAKQSSLLLNSRIVVIHNPVDEVFFNSNNKHLARNLLKIDDQSTVGILVAADLQDPNKNISSAVNAFLQLTQQRSDCILLLVGKNGEQYSNMNKSIHWLGELNPIELSKIGSAADFISVTSIAETAPLVIGEFAAMGVPAVTVGDTGASTMVEQLKTGIRAVDIREYFEIICRLKSSSNEVRELSEQAQIFAKKNFSPLQVAQEYLNLYESHE